MKTKYIIQATIAIIIFFGSVAFSQEFEYKVTTELESTVLKIQKLNSHIEIIGTDEKLIRLSTSGIKPLPEKAKGLKPLLVSGTNNTGIGLELLPSEENPNTLVLRQSRRNIGKKLRIELPKNLAIDFDAHMNQGLNASGLSGELTAKTLNGALNMSDVTGPLILNTVNGNINIALSNLNQEFPSSISSVNGEIDVSIDENEKAEIRLSLVNGEAFSNLDLDDKSDKSDMNHLAGKFKTTSLLNGGGVKLSISTLNGKIYLRKLEPAAEKE